MSILFNIRKKFAEKQAEHEERKLQSVKTSVAKSLEIQKIHDKAAKSRADQELELQSLKRKAQQHQDKILTPTEKKFLIEQKNKNFRASLKRKKMLIQARENFIRNSKTIGKAIGKGVVFASNEINKANTPPKRSRSRRRRKKR